MRNVHLVTGGNGFLGHLIARRLLARGERVRVLDIWDFPERDEQIEYVNCDIMNRDGLAAALRDVSVVHHNVAVVPLAKDRQRFAQINCEGSRIVAEEARRAGVDAFIHMSSSAVFGKPECPVTSASPMQPIESYGESKLASEAAVRETLADCGMNLIIIRPRTIIGTGRLGIFQILFDWISEGRRIYIIGNGSNRFQFVHASDLIDFYMLALASERPGSYNVGTDRFATLREDLEELIKHAATGSRVSGLPAPLTIAACRLLDRLRVCPLAPWHYETYHIDFHFEVSELLSMGWKPAYSNAQMLIESYDWLQKNPGGGDTGHGTSIHRKPVAGGILNILRRLS